MFEILKGALGSIFNSKVEGKSQVLEMIQKLLTGNKEKQRQFEMKMEELYQAQLDKEISDRQDARAMQIAALGQNDTFSKRFVYVLSAVVIAVILVALGGLMYFDIPAGNESLVNRVVDIFQNCGMSVLGYYFGTRVKKGQ